MSGLVVLQKYFLRIADTMRISFQKKTPDSFRPGVLFHAVLISDYIKLFHAFLYAFNNYSILGFFSSVPSEKEIKAGLHMIPDRLLLVEQVEPELKLRSIDWEDIIETSLFEALNMSFYTSSESNYVFKRM